MVYLSGRWPRKTFNVVLLGSLIAAYLLIEVSPFIQVVFELLGIGAVTPVLTALTVLFNIGFAMIVILRLHDLNRTGWWTLLIIIPFVNVLFVILLMLWPSSTQSHKFKNMMKTLIKILSFVILAVLLMQIDDDLNDEVVAFISLHEQRASRESQAYLYLNGIAALEEKEIIARGARLLAASLGKTSDAKKLSKGDKLATPDDKDEMYCHLADAGCLGNIIDSSSRWGNEINKFSVITERYEKFISYPEFTTLSKATANAPMVDYRYLFLGNKIKIFSALSLAESGKPEQAIEMLLTDNKYLRKQLTLADSVVHKGVFKNLLSYNLDVIVYIHLAYQAKKLTEITSLSKTEISMNFPLGRELLSEYNTYQYVPQSSEHWPSWVIKIIFKPNMTINQRFTRHEEIMSLDNLSGKAFAKSAVNLKATVKSEANYRNYQGEVLAEMPIISFRYIAMMHDLNAKISLANFVLSDKTQPLQNPYGALYNKITERGNLICLDGPLADKKSSRCIRDQL